MRGQFFILGAVILIIAISTGFYTLRAFASIPTEDIPYFSSNLKTEFPKALNFGVNAGTPTETLENFTRFLNRTLVQHYVDFDSFWIVATGNRSTDLTFTAGNFLDQDVNLSVNVSGADQNVSVSANSTNSVAFTGVPSVFNVTFMYNGEEETAEWVRDKTNLYCMLTIGRREDLNREEFTA